MTALILSAKKMGYILPWREESEYDKLCVGHSSTSISAGLGMAVAAEQEKLNRKNSLCDW